MTISATEAVDAKIRSSSSSSIGDRLVLSSKIGAVATRCDTTASNGVQGARRGDIICIN